MFSSILKRHIQKLGFSEAYLQEKVQETLALAKAKNLVFSPNTPFFVCYDMNGPLTGTHDAALRPYPGIPEALALLGGERIKKALVSGWDVRTLRAFRDKRLGLPDLFIIGEHGTAWEEKGVAQEVAPVSQEEVLAMKLKIVEAAARANLKLAIQGNESSRVTGIFFEADGRERGNVLSHLLLEGKRAQTEDIFSAFRGDAGFRYSQEKIAFPLYERTLQEFDRVLRTVFPLHSVRLQKKGSEILCWRDTKDRPSFMLEDMEEVVSKSLSAPWRYMVHDDFGVDILYEDDSGRKVNKESTSCLVANEFFSGMLPVITNAGDRVSDVFIGERCMFFAQQGSEAEQHCRANTLPHVTIEDGRDYSLIIASLLGI